MDANALYLRTPLRHLATLLHTRSGLLLAVLLGPPLIWMCVIYLGALLALLWQGLYSFDDFSMSVLPQLTLKNYAAIFVKGNFDIVLRTLAMAVAVTIGAALIAFPIAYYMSRYATPTVKACFYIGVMLPMWASYIVKAYSWSVILAKGAAYYKDFGLGRSRGTIPLQIAGNVKYGGLYETAFGLTLGEIVDKIAGGCFTDRPVKAVQVGGPLGAYFPTSLLDTPLDYEAMAASKGMLGHGGIVVFDTSVDMALQARFAMEFCAVESCGKCTPCRIGSTRGVEVIDRIIAGDNRDANLDLLDSLCDTMLHGSLCALGGMAPYPVKSALTHFPQDFGITPVTAE